MLYLQVTKYEGNRKLEWDNFLKSSKNGHFFFYRDYMEYHSDRFQDFSLIIYNDKGNIMALLPASIDGDTVMSHGGLTFVSTHLMKLYMHCFVIMQNYIGEMCHFLFINQIDCDIKSSVNELSRKAIDINIYCRKVANMRRI